MALSFQMPYMCVGACEDWDEYISERGLTCWTVILYMYESVNLVNLYLILLALIKGTSLKVPKSSSTNNHVRYFQF